MAKPKLRMKARLMRQEGCSVKEIADKLNVSKGTVSYWVRDVNLSIDQIEELRNRHLKGAERGRLLGALAQKQKRLKKIEYYNKKGISRFKNISDKELFVLGLGLYWGEGSKKTREVRFCNSDPKMMSFMAQWLEIFFGIKKSDIRLIVGINEVHRHRELTVKRFWSKAMGVPMSQFRKTSFKKVKNRKVYKNTENHYGTLTIVVLKPARIYYRIMGLIEGLSSQGSSVGRAQHS